MNIRSLLIKSKHQTRKLRFDCKRRYKQRTIGIGKSIFRESSHLSAWKHIKPIKKSFIECNKISAKKTCIPRRSESDTWNVLFALIIYNNNNYHYLFQSMDHSSKIQFKTANNF